jgi:hypothetical protein
MLSEKEGIKGEGEGEGKSSKLQNVDAHKANQVVVGFI